MKFSYSVNRRALIPLTIIAAIALTAACEKNETENVGISAKKAFDAWVKTHLLPEQILDSTSLDALILSDRCNPDSAEVKDSAWLFIHYVVRNLRSGEITASTEAKYAKQLGTYDSTYYYGPTVFENVPSALAVGIIDLIKGGDKFGRMRVSGEREGIIPSWLTTTTTYSTVEEYINNSSSTDDVECSIRIEGMTDDIYDWQDEEIQKYADRQKYYIDSTGTGGIWYCTLIPPTTTDPFPSDTTIYINYTGRLTNGKVFDTNIARVAKDNGIYSSSSSYTPQSVTFSSDSTALKMGSSSVIKGFSLGVYRMRAFETAVILFNSKYGYGTSGSGMRIPGYAPLVFEVSVVEKPE